MDKDHVMIVSGLQVIPPLEGLHPIKTRLWRLLLVVPIETESTFELQKLDGDADTGIWARNVHQNVSGL
jgi:hypothetical protein